MSGVCFRYKWVISDSSGRNVTLDVPLFLDVRQLDGGILSLPASPLVLLLNIAVVLLSLGRQTVGPRWRRLATPGVVAPCRFVAAAPPVARNLHIPPTQIR